MEFLLNPFSVLDNLKSNIKPNELWLTIDNLPQYKKNTLVDKLRLLRIRLRALSNISNLTSRKITLDDLRDLNLYELIGRNPVKPNVQLLKKCIFKKNCINHRSRWKHWV